MERIIDCDGRKYRISDADGWVDVHALGFTGWSRVFRPRDAVEIAEAMIECANSIVDGKTRVRS